MICLVKPTIKGSQYYSLVPSVSWASIILICLLSSFFMAISNHVAAQPPNDDCINATVLSIDAACTPFSTATATSDGKVGSLFSCDNYICGGPPPDAFGVWFKFTADVTEADIYITSSTFTSFQGYPFVGVYDACGGNEVGCLKANSYCGDDKATITGLTEGVTYWVLVSGLCEELEGGCIQVASPTSGNMGDGNLPYCSGTLYDDGGPSGDYSTTNYASGFCANTCGSGCVTTVGNGTPGFVKFCFNLIDLDPQICGGQDVVALYNGDGSLNTVFDGSDNGTTPCITTSVGNGNAYIAFIENCGVNGYNGFELTWDIVDGADVSQCGTCSDGILNQNETAVDCGGICLPTTPNAGPDQRMCGVSATTLAGNNIVKGSGQWTEIYPGSTVSFSDDSDPLTTISGMDDINGDSVVLRWTAILNASCTLTDDIAIIIDGKPSSATAGSNIAECNITTTTLAANSPGVGTGSWSVISGTASVTDAFDPVSGVTGLIPGNTATLVWTISSGICADSTDTMTIVVSLPPSTSVAGSDQTVCNNFSALEGNAPEVGTGQWTFVSGAGTITSNSSPTSGVTGLVVGSPATFRWTISNPGCPSSTEIGRAHV